MYQKQGGYTVYEWMSIAYNGEIEEWLGMGQKRRGYTIHMDGDRIETERVYNTYGWGKDRNDDVKYGQGQN